MRSSWIYTVVLTGPFNISRFQTWTATKKHFHPPKRLHRGQDCFHWDTFSRASTYRWILQGLHHKKDLVVIIFRCIEYQYYSENDIKNSNFHYFHLLSYSSRFVMQLLQNALLWRSTFLCPSYLHINKSDSIKKTCRRTPPPCMVVKGYQRVCLFTLFCSMDGMWPKLVLTTHEREWRDPVSRLWRVECIDQITIKTPTLNIAFTGVSQSLYR
jgi:hypothetical protein